MTARSKAARSIQPTVAVRDPQRLLAAPYKDAAKADRHKGSLMALTPEDRKVRLTVREVTVMVVPGVNATVAFVQTPMTTWHRNEKDVHPVFAGRLVQPGEDPNRDAKRLRKQLRAARRESDAVWRDLPRSSRKPRLRPKQVLVARY